MPFELRAGDSGEREREEKQVELLIFIDSMHANS